MVEVTDGAVQLACRLGPEAVQVEPSRVTVSEATVAGVETVIRGIPEVRQIFSTVGVNGDALRARLQVKTTPKQARERGLLAIKADARARLADVPLVKATVTDPEFMQGAPSEAPVNIFVRGDDMVVLQRLSDEVVTKVRQVPGAVDVDSTLEGGQPEMVAQVNRALAADLGFQVATVASQLRGMVEGVVPTKLRDGEDEFDIRVRLAPEYRNDFDTDRPHAALFVARRRRAHR